MTTGKITRRQALKALLAAGGGIGAASFLPARWLKPVVHSGVLPAHASTSSLPISKPTLPGVTTVSITGVNMGSNKNTFNGNVTSQGNSHVTVRGFVWGTNLDPTLTDPSDQIIIVPGGGAGAFSASNVTTGYQGDWYGRAYATNSVGTAYGDSVYFNHYLCLAEGTLIMLAGGTLKKIEDISYSDWLTVWDFDHARFDRAQPLWIKKPETASRYNLLEFSDGSSLKTIAQHRIFNKEKGMFTYPMSDDTPLGTTTFNAHGKEVTLVNKSVVPEPVNHYNIITHRHINLFANGILTSCRYNNIYPIADMKFVKDNRIPLGQGQFGVDPGYYEGLRLAEQTIPVAETIAYIKRLEANKLLPGQKVFHKRNSVPDHQSHPAAFGLRHY
jgi:hypothetical protein